MAGVVTASPVQSGPYAAQRVSNPRIRAESFCRVQCNAATMARDVGVKLTPLHHTFGVEIEGLDLSRPLSGDQKSLVNSAMDTHDAILFRGQALTPADEERLLLTLPHDAQVDCIDEALQTSSHLHCRHTIAAELADMCTRSLLTHKISV